MDYQFKFSIIIAVYNVEDYLCECIDSVINQTLDFNENVQLILVDDGSTDDSLKIAEEYRNRYPENIILLSQSNQGQSKARNNGLKYVKAKYVNFLDSDDYISKNTLEVVYNFFEEHFEDVDVVAIPMMLFERVNLPHRLNDKFNSTRVISLDDEPNTPQLSSSSAFIKYDAIKEYEFDTKLVNLEDALIINKIFLDKKKYGVVNTAEYYYRQRLDATSTVDAMKENKRYFTERLENFYITLADYSFNKEGHIPKFIQYLFAYDLQWLLKVDSLDVFDNESEVDNFWKVLSQVLDYIDVDVIDNNPYIENNIRSFFIYLKNNRNKVIKEENGDIVIYSDKEILDRLSDNPLWFDIVELKNGYLNFSGNYESCFPNETLSIHLVYDHEGERKVFEVCPVEYNNPKRMTQKFLDSDWIYTYNFDVNIIQPPENTILSFELEYNDGNFQNKIMPHISFRNNCGLSTSCAYFVKNSKILLFKNNKFHLLPYSFKSMLRYEASNLKRINYDKQPHYKFAIFAHILYFILYPFMKNKRIWIYSDRPEFADDNAKALFEYSCDIKDGVKKYFIVDRDSSSYNDLKRINKNIVAFGSLKHEILYLFAEKVISSYVNENFINPFHYFTPSLYSGLVTSYRYFLQHGVTKDDVSEFIKKYDKNLALIVCVSDLEQESFMKKGYNFDSNVIQTLGFPRFDKLSEDNSKKQILFAPTWRIGLNHPNKLYESEYYKTLNAFFNNDELKRLLEDTGYTLLFKPHPELIEFIDLFDIPDYVIVSTDKSYQKLFKESSLLITDYSSIFFDFAYMKKPVIYYQKDEDYHYDKGYFDYEKMGFGQVIKDEKELIKSISASIEKNCSMDDIYIERVNEFFKYHDKNNSKRVYEWILDD